MGHVPSNFVPQSLGLDDGNLLQDKFVVIKVQTELLVVSLDQLLGSPLRGLGSDTSLGCGEHWATWGGEVTMRWMDL